MSDKNENVVIFVLGVLSAIVTQIIAFFFGSSSGSKEKTEAMNSTKIGG